MVKKLVHNRQLLLTVVGLAIMAQSIAWEYVRVVPNYRFLIDPWSLRGYEVDQGPIIAIGALVIAALAILVTFGVLKESLLHSAIASGVLIVLGTVAAIMTDAKDVTMPFIVKVILSAIGAVVIRSLLNRFIPETWAKRRRASVGGLWLVGFVFTLFAVVGPIFNGERPLWLVVVVVGTVLTTLSLFRPPVALAGWRIVINGILILWVMAMTMSATLRTTLDNAQFDLNGLSVDLKNLQITSGVLLAWLGGLIAIVGAVGLWASRRDEIIAIERARSQQEAARESEAQLSVTG